jgi:uncharacterized SAM-binding protein YcdF (DUF218 family)
MAFRRRDRGAPIRWAIDALAVVAALWVIGLFWYAHEIASLTSGPTNGDTAKADAVVVLTGSTDRLTQGFELLAEGRAQRLFISGVYRGVDVQQILRALRRSPSEAHDAIVLGYGADDTAGNAQETSVWMAKEGLTSLILVTSNFHMPRALVEFHAAMPQVTIMPRATSAPSFHIDDWWWWPGTLRLIANEWTKYLAARTTLALGIRLPSRPTVSPAPMEAFPLPEAGPAPVAQPSADPSPPVEKAPPVVTSPQATPTPAPKPSVGRDTPVESAPQGQGAPQVAPEPMPDQAPAASTNSDSDEPDDTPPPDDPLPESPPEMLPDAPEQPR